MECASRQTSMVYDSKQHLQKCKSFLDSSQVLLGKLCSCLLQSGTVIHVLDASAGEDSSQRFSCGSTHLSLASQLSARIRSKILSSSKLQLDNTFVKPFKALHTVVTAYNTHLQSSF